MKITFVLPTVNLSGGIKVALIHAKALQDVGHHVLVVSPPPRQITFWESLGYFVKRKGWRKTDEWQVDLPRNFSMKESFALTHHVLDHWRPVIDGDLPDADIVIATWWETAEWVAKLSPSKGCKVYLIQGHEIFNNAERAQSTYWLPLHKIVISKWLQDVMRVLYRDERCSLVENGVDQAWFDAPERSKQGAITVGTLISSLGVKNSALAIDVIIQAKRRLPKLRVLAFGMHKAPENLPGWVEYHLNPNQDDIPSIYAACDAWLFTSRAEGFGLPLLEAMACRTPVLSTYAGAAPEIISADNGRLLPDSTDAFVQAILDFADMENSEWKVMSDHAYASSRKYSWDASTRKLESVLAGLIDNVSIP